jgi:tetratricopeptide (TPR) repeat protein
MMRIIFRQAITYHATMNILRRFISVIFFSLFLLQGANAFGQNNVDSSISSVKNLSSDTEKVSTLLDMVSRVYCEDSDYKIKVAAYAKQLAENIKWYHGQNAANLALGEVYFNCCKNYDKAFVYLKDNVRLAEERGYKEDQAIALEIVGKYYERTSQYYETIEYFNKALAIKPGFEVEIGILGDKGVVLNSIGAFSEALKCYDDALKLIKENEPKRKGSSLEDSTMKVALYANIGELYLSANQLNKALENYTNANDMASRINNKVFIVSSLIGIGNTYRAQKDYNRAISYYQIALDSCRGLTNFTYEVRVLNELANTYLDTWSYTNALTYADSSLRLAETQNYIELLSKANATLGNVYIKQGKYDLAIFYLKKALDIAKGTRILDDQREAWQWLTKAYQLGGKYAEAFDALNNYNVVKDSLNAIANNNEFIRRDVQNEFRNQQVIDSMRQAGEYEKNISRQQTFTYAGFTALVLVVLLAFFIYRNYIIQKKYNELLSKEKVRHLAHIEAQSNVLTDIAQTQAHEVRGPVATILGLIHLFNHEDPTDPVNKDVIDKLDIATKKLDKVIKDIIRKENKLRFDDEK